MLDPVEASIFIENAQESRRLQMAAPRRRGGGGGGVMLDEDDNDSAEVVRGMTRQRNRDQRSLNATFINVSATAAPAHNNNNDDDVLHFLNNNNDDDAAAVADNGRPRRPRRRAAAGVIAAAAAQQSVELCDDTPPFVLSPDREQMLRTLGQNHGGSERCFACKYARGVITPLIARTGIEKIQTIVRSTPTGANKAQVACEIQDHFDERIRKVVNARLRPGEEECPPWLAVDIYDHYFTAYHDRIDAASSLDRRVGMFERILQRQYDDDTWVEQTMPNGHRRVVPEPKRVESLLKISSYLDRLYAIKPSSLAVGTSDGIAVGRSSGVVEKQQRRVYNDIPGQRM